MCSTFQKLLINLLIGNKKQFDTGLTPLRFVTSRVNNVEESEVEKQCKALLSMRSCVTGIFIQHVLTAPDTVGGNALSILPFALLTLHMRQYFKILDFNRCNQHIGGM